MADLSRALAAIGALILATAAPAADVDFNHYTSPADNDLVNQFQVGGSYQQTTGQGITGGAVASQSGPGGFATYLTSYSQPGSVSISFLYDGPETQGLGPSARLGWVGALGPVDFFAPTLYFWGEFYNDGSFNVRNNPTGQSGQGEFVTLGTIAAPALGHWLRLNLSAAPLGGGNYALGLSLDDLGTSGLDSPASLFTGSTQVANAMASADGSLYAGFFGYYRAPYYDNFSVQAVPEPGSLVLIGAGAVLLGAVVRWRRRARPAHQAPSTSR